MPRHTHKGHTLKHTHTQVGHKYKSNAKAHIRPVEKEVFLQTHTHTYTPRRQQSRSKYYLKGKKKAMDDMGGETMER